MSGVGVHPVSAARHASKRWRRFDSYAWAATEILVPVFASELAAAAAHMPLAFVQQGEEVLLAAMIGLEPGACLFIDADGRWFGGYVPAILRTRPFLLAPTEDGRRIFCVDEAAAGLGESVEPGTEAFFDAQGKLSSATEQVLQFVSRVDEARLPTAAACAAVLRHKLLVPWAITLQTDQGERRSEGLMRVDEAVFNTLPDEALLDLWRLNALPVIYAHLMSTQHLSTLGQLARARAAAAKPVTPVTSGGDLDLSFLGGGDTLRFS